MLAKTKQLAYPNKISSLSKTKAIVNVQSMQLYTLQKILLSKLSEYYPAKYIDIVLIIYQISSNAKYKITYCAKQKFCLRHNTLKF